MAFISMPGFSELIIIGIILIYWGFIIATGISILKRRDITLSSRLLWIIILLIAPLIGIIIYNFYGQPEAKRA